jgi:cell division protein ZapA
MSNVTLSIGGRSFTVACADGEEGHVAGLGRIIDGKLAEMGGAANQSEPRMLLFAALLLADELQEARASTPQSPPNAGLPDHLGEKLETIAARIENLAASLEG